MLLFVLDKRKDGEQEDWEQLKRDSMVFAEYTVLKQHRYLCTNEKGQSRSLSLSRGDDVKWTKRILTEEAVPVVRFITFLNVCSDAEMEARGHFLIELTTG